MKIRLITNVCFLASAGCMLAGYWLAKFWYILLILFVMTITWCIIRNKSGLWPVSLILVIYIGLAVFGFLINLSPYLMAIGCTAALATWDLVLFRKDIDADSDKPKISLLEMLHMRSLTIAIGFGFLLSVLGLNIHFHLPFVVIAGLSLVSAFGLYQSFRNL